MIVPSKCFSKPILFCLFASSALSCHGDSPNALSSTPRQEPSNKKLNSNKQKKLKKMREIPVLDDFKLQFDCPDVFWDTMYNCYNAGGTPLVDFDTCTYYSCEGVGGTGEQGESYCSTYTVDGEDIESCVECPQGQEMLYSDEGYPKGCSPIEETNTSLLVYPESTDANDGGFGIQSFESAPYAQVVIQDNSSCAKR